MIRFQLCIQLYNPIFDTIVLLKTNGPSNQLSLGLCSVTGLIHKEPNWPMLLVLQENE